MEKTKKKWIVFAVIAAVIIGGAIWAKGYYQDRYVARAAYYTQIPLDEKNDKTTYLKDKDGKQMAKGKNTTLWVMTIKGTQKMFSSRNVEKQVTITHRELISNSIIRRQ